MNPTSRTVGVRDLIAGVDAGTSSIKVVLFTPEGAHVAVGRSPTPWVRTAHGEECDARVLASAAREALAAALEHVPGARVTAIGIASMGESGILLDDAERPLAPVIAWHDTRDTGELASLESDLGGDVFSERTGLPLWAQWSLTKHRWLRRHCPGAERAVRRFSVAEWLAYDLGGEHVSELSLASRTGMLDIRQAQWWPEAIDWAQADPSLFGRLVAAGSPAGYARGTAAWAAVDGAVITVAGHDHQVAAIGLGSFETGDEFDSVGTAEAILRTSEPHLPPAAVRDLTRAGITVGHHAAPGRWCLLGGTQGGLILQRVLTSLGVDRDGLARLDQEAASADDVPSAVRLGSGDNEQIDPAASRGEVWRAATSAVSGLAAELSARLAAAAGPRRDLVVAGGWTYSDAVRAAKTRAFGACRFPDVPEAGCRGAALLAGVANGTFRDLAHAVTTFVPPTELEAPHAPHDHP